MTLCTLGLSAQTDFYYELPEGAFCTGYGTCAGYYAPNVYMPYNAKGYTWKATEAGDWALSGSSKATGSTEFNQTFNLGYFNYIPVLTASEATYQYGKSYTGSSTWGRVYAGSASMVYLTPAKLFDPAVVNSGITQAYGTVSTTATYSAFTTYFHNIDVMYIDEIQIPIRHSSTTATISDIFPEGSYVTLNVYSATITKKSDGTYSKSKSSTPIFTCKLTKENYTQASKEYVGSLGTQLSTPLSINGSFAIEIVNSGCNFYLYYAKHKVSTGLSTMVKIEDGKTYSPGTAVFAFSVHAMFPALTADVKSGTALLAPLYGRSKTIEVHSNIDPKDFNITKPDWVDVDITYEGPEFAATKASYITFKVAKSATSNAKSDIVISNRGKEIKYTIQQASLTKKITISDSKWATFATDYPVTIPSGITAYTATVDGTIVTLSKITTSIIPANTGVILYTDAPGEYAFTETTEDIEPFTENDLVAAINVYNYTADENVYYLGLDGEKVVFKHLTSGSIAAGKAYLLAPASAAKLDVVVEGTPTGITEVVPMAVKNDGIYNIQGVRVNNSFKGVVIMNGKKYLRSNNTHY